MTDADIEIGIMAKTCAFFLAYRIENGLRDNNYEKFIEERGLTEEFERFLIAKKKKIAKELLEQYSEAEREWIKTHIDRFKKITGVEP